MKTIAWISGMITHVISSVKRRWAEICTEFFEPEDLAAPFEPPAFSQNLPSEARPGSATTETLKSLLRQACDLLSEERDEIFSSHQIGGKLVVDDVFSANAAERIRQIDDLIKAAAVAINSEEAVSE